jgi:dihydroorotate dehydrogenase electron transfer subunit
MMNEQAEVAFNRPLTSETWLMGLRSMAVAQSAYPGQFVTIRVREGVDPLLRRPFSICGTEGDLFLVLYRVVGKGTEIMSREIGIGDRVSVLGPLGRGFIIPDEERRLLLIGGGLGIAPLLFLAQRLGSRKFRFMAGFGSASQCIPAQEVLDLSVKLEIATDDGTEGHHGLVSELLEKCLRESSGETAVQIFACGPAGMLKNVASTAMTLGIPFQASLEAPMACGLGACLGCVVKAAPTEERSYYYVCKDGPVFSARMIDWGSL